MTAGAKEIEFFSAGIDPVWDRMSGQDENNNAVFVTD